MSGSNLGELGKTFGMSPEMMAVVMGSSSFQAGVVKQGKPMSLSPATATTTPNDKKKTGPGLKKKNTKPGFNGLF